MKFYGSIGFATDVETAPGIWEPKITERKYMGDLIRVRRNFTNQVVNGSISMNNQISIIADPYAVDNFASICYAEFNGCKWIVEGVELNYPRLLLSLGSKYND